MGKRGRRRAAPSQGSPASGSASLSEPLAELANLVDMTGLTDSASTAREPVDYADEQGNVLTLRTSFTPAARREYAQTRSGERGPAAATREDAWQRAGELLFERLAVSWTIAGTTIGRPRGLLERYRAASPPERAWVRDVLREHCAEHFPDVRAP